MRAADKLDPACGRLRFKYGGHDIIEGTSTEIAMSVARAAREVVRADAVRPERSLHARQVGRDHAIYRIELAPQTGHVAPNVSVLSLRRYGMVVTGAPILPGVVQVWGPRWL